MAEFTEEALNQLIEEVKNYKPKPPCLPVTRAWVEAEQSEHPNDITVDSNGFLFWRGYLLLVVGDDFSVNEDFSKYSFTRFS